MFDDLTHLLKKIDISWHKFGERKQEVGIVTAFLEGIKIFLSQNNKGRIVREIVQPAASRQLEECFEAFCEGVDYIHLKYGTRPNSIILTNDDSDTPYYNVDSGNVYVPQRFLEALVDTGALKNSKTGDECLNPTAMATMYGVEEAFHHYQFSQHYDRYESHLENLPVLHRTDDYDLNPIEADAKVEVQAALTAFRKIRPQEFSAILPPTRGTAPGQSR